MPGRLFALVGAALGAGAANADLTLTTLLESGAQAPVGEPDVVFESFIGAPALAASTGELLVRARLAGPTVDNTNDIGIFVVGPTGEVALLAREGDHAPGLAPSVRYANLNTNFLPAFNAVGDVVFPATLTGGGFVNGEDLGLLLGTWGPCSGVCKADLNGDGQVDGADLGILLGAWGVCDGFCQADLTGETIFTNNDTAVFAGRPGAVQALLQEGAPAPGLAPAGTKLTGFSQAVITNTGAVGVRATIQYPPAPNGSGRLGFATWVYESPSPTLVAASEVAAPGFAPGLAYSTVGGLSINSGDTLSFIGGVFNPVSSELAGSGVWGGAVASYSLLSRSDDPAPGTETGTQFRTFSGVPLQGSTGDAIFLAFLKGPSIVFGNDLGLWRHREGAVSLVARVGDDATEVGPGITIDSIETPIGDASRTCVFRAEFVGAGVTTANDQAIIAVDPDDARRLVVRTGEQATGAAPGQMWSNFPFPPTVNANGRTAFLGQLTGPGVTSANREGIWLVEEDGGTTLVARQGEFVEVAPGDTRQIFGLSALLSTGVDTGEARGIDDADDLVLTINFTDLSSAIVRASVPAAEPGDLNDDGLVNGADLGLLLGAWGGCPAGCAADMNTDGVVDGADLGLLLGLWTT
jgi:hypothetical protein